MKTREDLVRVIRIMVETEKNFERDYETHQISFKNFQILRRDIKLRLDSLLWVVGVKKCFYDYWSIEETFMRAKEWLALLDNANTTPSC